MNPSVNPNNPDEPIRRFIHLLLFQAQQDRATELVIGVASDTGTPMRYKVEETWQDFSPFPAHIRPGVISELARMANLSAKQIPGEGVLDAGLGNTRLKWLIKITGTEEECILTRIQD
jgi:hypothetical protein